MVDEWRARVVVLAPEYSHKKGNGASDAQNEAQNILENRGNAPRLYRNMLVFIAPDATNAEAWEKALREYLAWKSIQDEAEPLNLDAQQRKQVDISCKRTEETLLVRLQETYSWLIVPAQPDPTGPIEYQAHRITGQDSFYDRAARKLRQNEQIISLWSPDNLRIELDRYLWREEPHLGIKQLWEYLARYCYLPRLHNEDVLRGAIAEGVQREEDAPFAYATLFGLDGDYKGLVFQKAAPTIYFDDNALIVRPEVAQEQIERQKQPPQPPVSDPPPPEPKGGGGGGNTPPPPPPLTTRYHGTVALNPQRVNKDMAMIVDEIIQHLTGLTGTEVRITIEISAERPAGFDDATIRTINENSRQLKFTDHGFEKE